MDSVYILFFPGNYYRLPYHQRSQDFIEYMNGIDSVAKICLLTIRTPQTRTLLSYIKYAIHCATGTLEIMHLNEKMVEVGIFEPAIPRRIRKALPERVVNLLYNLLFPSFLTLLILARFDRMKKAADIPHRGVFDIAFFASHRLMTIGLALKRLNLVRILIYKDHDILPVLTGDRGLSGIEERMSRGADLVVSVSETLRQLRIRQGATRTLAVPHGVDLRMFRSAAAARYSPTSPRRNTLMFVGQVDRRWGVELAVKALSRLERADARLMIVGGGPDDYIRYLKRLSSQLGVQNQISFCGPARYEEIPELLSHADIGLAPYPQGSAAEFGVPLKIKEYCAAGLPVVSTEVAEIRRFIEESKGGLVTRYDERDFANAILSLLEDDFLYRTKSENGKRYVERFDWSTLFQEEWETVRSLYVSLLRHGRKRGCR